MLLISGITDEPRQEHRLLLADGTFIDLSVGYSSQQYGWFIENLIYGSFTLNGVRIVNSPNFLRQFKNQIPFGMACYVEQDQEPMLQQDFLSGRAKLYILPASEVAVYEDILSGQAAT
jgi:hypothetical protein